MKGPYDLVVEVFSYGNYTTTIRVYDEGYEATTNYDIRGKVRELPGITYIDNLMSIDMEI